MKEAVSLPTGALARLLQTEARLEARLEAARREAASLLAEARRRAQRSDQPGAELEERIAAERRQVEEDCERQLAELEAARQRAVARYDVPPERLAELARYVVGRVLGDIAGDEQTGPPSAADRTPLSGEEP